jgi:enoyl-CoA hydratase/3-hydroxypropionyl-coenzyme A dehydratase
MSEQDHLQIERRDRCVCIRLNRPEKANALSVGLMDDARRALIEAAADTATRAIVLTGAGERVFSAGADVREQPADGDRAAHRRRRSAGLAALIDAILDGPKPVVAAVNGIASGGGAMLALLADARVAAEEAALSMPEIDLGLSTFMGAAIAEQIGGLALAVDLVQSGRRMPAREALARGLVNSVVPRTELEEAAFAMAAVLARKDPRAYAANKQWLNRHIKAALTEARAAHEAHRRAQQQSE